MVGKYFFIILIILTIASAIVGLLDKYYFEAKRRKRFEALPNSDTFDAEAQEAYLKPPLVAEYARSLFIVFFLVLMIRAFVVELYRIPTGSMLPNLQINDFLLVDKYSYGIRLPIGSRQIVPVGLPQNGDIAVVRYPVNPQVYFIKRVIGIPGDKISYINKHLYINGKEVERRFDDRVLEPDDSLTRMVEQYQEKFNGHQFKILLMPWRQGHDFYNLTVPPKQYFLMGDNRDNSGDSRYWGFVSEKQLVGKPLMILFSWDAANNKIRWRRLGRLINQR